MPSIRRTSRLVASVLLPAALAAGCNDFLADPQAVNNPNFPTSASINQLFVGVQVGQTTTQAGDLARTLTTWMQQFSGTDRQYFAISRYSYGEDSFDAEWEQIYQGGGLLDIRRVEALADSSGDATYGGIARVWEALTLGTAADIWGDIPLASALQVDSAPKLTEQIEVYAAVQAKLDTAITLLAQNKGAGPGAADLFYGGDRQKYTRLAHTLKARYFLHTAERAGAAADGGPAFDAAAYQRALAEAQQGLQAADDFRTFQSSNPNEANLWYQFTVIERAGYISPSSFFVDLLATRNDPRLRRYFAPGSGGTVVGSAPRNGGPAGTVASLNPEGGAPGNPAYRSPVVTFAENQYIIGEAAFRLGQPGVALAAINAYRATVTGLAATSAAELSLAEIMTQKYIALFQQMEVWNDYKRTCIPRLTPVGTGTIPARIIYPQSERIANPNIPEPDAQPDRNDNDPNACPGSA